MTLQNKIAQVSSLDGYLNHFALTSKGECIISPQFSVDDIHAKKVHQQFISAKKNLKESNIIHNLQGFTAYGKHTNSLTFFTGQTGQRIIITLFLKSYVDIDKTKFKIYSLFEIE